MKLNKQKNEEIISVKRNTESIKKVDEQIKDILSMTVSVRIDLSSEYSKCMQYHGKDYLSLDEEQRISLGELVNNAKSLSAMLTKKIVD